MAKEFRINKYIAECLGCSRRNAEQYVLDGLVKVNNKKISDLGVKVTLQDKVFVKNEQIKLQSHSYVLFYKPAGYISTRDDEKNRKTIYDLLPEEMYKFKPVGRLDRDTSGLMLLTNDGDLINTLTHPKFQIPKTYKLKMKGRFTDNDVTAFRKGIYISKDELAKADVIEVIPLDKNYTSLTLELKQGYNRQIRRMVEKLNYEVVSLKRLTIGCLNLKKLKRSEYCVLSKNEVQKLFEYVDKRAKMFKN